jgi:activating signal cointegrator 1
MQKPSPTIPALTLWQPWASFIAIGVKPYETRSKPPPLRLVGLRIAIHAAARKPRWSDLDSETHRAMCEAFGSGHQLPALPLGVILCTADLAETLPVERVLHDPFGDYSTGRWAWRLEDLRRVEPYAPAKGMQLWGWPWHVPAGVRL